jgi:hypothetical protein
MKVLTLKLNNKTYMTGKITAFLSKEALKIQKEALALGKKGKEIQQLDAENHMEEIEVLLNALAELRERKTWLICEVYQNKFDVETLEKSLSDDEIDEEVNKILYGIAGVISKN